MRPKSPLPRGHFWPRGRVREGAGGALVVALLLAAAAGGCRGAARTTVPAPSDPAVLRVATSGDYAPFSSATDGVPGGMDVEVAERLGRDLGMRVEFVRIRWPDLAAATRRGDFDIAMGGVTMRADRALVGRYSRPYATVAAVALVRSDDARRFATAADLDRPDVRIAVNAGGHLERLAQALFPHAAVRPVVDNHAVPARVLDRRADAALSDTAEVREWLRPGLRAIGPFSFDHKAYLLPARDEALAVRLDAWLVAREADGWLDGERVRWLGAAASMDADASGRESVAALVRQRLDLMPSVAVAKRAAGLPIEDRAQEERVIARARAMSSQPDQVEAVYRQLIDMAKAVQRGAPTPQASAPLDALRDAVGRVDAQLVRELDRAPQGSVETWRVALSRTVAAPGLDGAAIGHLAEVLSAGHQ